VANAFSRVGHALLFCSALQGTLHAQDQPECRVCPVPTQRIEVRTNPNAKLWASVYVSKALVHVSEVDKLQVSFVVVNDGPTVVDPRIGASHLLVNGTEPRAWSLDINNGIQTSSFAALQPGKVVEFSKQLGPAYFRKPGVYTLKWQAPDFTSPR
jgi:hypothetical protein